MYEDLKQRGLFTRKHPVSHTHPPMSRQSRAAQFAPFAALSGHEEALLEAARKTDRKPVLDDEAQLLLNQQLGILMEHTKEQPAVTVFFFVADLSKAGGSCHVVKSHLKRIDYYQKKLYLTNGAVIPLGDILHLESRIFPSLSLP